MRLTASIFIKQSNPVFALLDEYAFLCKNLKNSVLYIYRQTFFESNKTPNKFDVIGRLTKEQQQDYCAIPRKVSQQLVYQVAQEFQSFWQLLKKWAKNKNELDKPNIPRYLHKERGRANVILTKQAISKKDLAKGILSLSPFDKTKRICIKLGKLANLIAYDNIQEVKVVKVANGYDVKIVYIDRQSNNLGVCLDNTLAENSKLKLGKIIDLPVINRALAVDFGINNLMSVANNIGEETLLIKGSPLKSINQYFNKHNANLKSDFDTVMDLYKPAIKRKLERLQRKRKHKVNDYLHKASRYLVNHAVENRIDTIVLGYNKGWKQEINIGKVNNQKFVNIPFLTLLKMIVYKANLQGINVIINEESYTSKCSFLDNEPICKHDRYAGKRIKRGLFRSATGKLINADINGAFNILRKVIGEFDYDPIQACSMPRTVNVLNHN